MQPPLSQSWLRLLSVGGTIAVMPWMFGACNEVDLKEPFEVWQKSAVLKADLKADLKAEHDGKVPETHDETGETGENHGNHEKTPIVPKPIVPKPIVPKPIAAKLIAKPQTPAELAKAKQAQADRAAVEAATTLWLATVTSGRATAATEVMKLYAEDAMLLGTVSEQVRDDRAEINSYFDYFTQLPRLSVSGYRSFVRVYGDTAINSGYYTFSYDKKGHTKVVPARFTFNYRRIKGQWLIEDHHSSAIPKAPEALKAAID